MKGYKAFDKNLRCRDMQYEIGKKYIFDREPIPCEQGYHFCKSIADCYRFYETSENTRICEISATGVIKTDDGIKYCTNKIKIIREIKNPRKKSNASKTSSGYSNSGEYNSGNYNIGNKNSGHYNSGNMNTGDRNSGSCNSGIHNSGSNNCGNGNSGGMNSGNLNSGNKNSGNYNSGSHNSGDYNSGYCNSGSHNSGGMNSGNLNSGSKNSGSYNSGVMNSGNKNSGNYNSGSHNSGDYNSGYYNSGNWNSGNYSSGLFNTDKNPKIKIFDIESEWTRDDWYKSLAFRVMDSCPIKYSSFISVADMTEEEKDNHPEHATIGGYVKIFTTTNSERQAWWDNLSDEDKQVIYSIPNFDADKFEMCTGIKPV